MDMLRTEKDVNKLTKMEVWTVLMLVLASLAVSYGGDHNKQPQHVHIAYGAEDNSMTVTWSTYNDTASFVLYGQNPKALQSVQKGYSSKFVDGGSEHRSQFIHKVELPELLADTVYYYQVGSADGWSSKFQFKTMPAGQNWSPSLAVYGDLGSDNAQSLPRLTADAALGMYDAIIHVGDFAYDMDSNNARVGDTFMQQIQVLAANLPYMTCPGNHEYSYNFSNYKARFSMPSDNGQMYYSFNMGPVHIISLSTEYYFFTEFGYRQITNQYEWLQKDLKEANTPENRRLRPWIITFGHRPMYCSNSNSDDCTKHNSLVRVGIPEKNIPGLEDLFYQHGVDLAIWAHEHSYERLWPIYNTQVMNGSSDQPYTNPKGIVHVTTGSAGCREDHDDFGKDKPDWSAYRSDDYGYTRMNFLNSTHLYVEQVSDDQEGVIIDKFILIKEKHGPNRSAHKVGC